MKSRTIRAVRAATGVRDPTGATGRYLGQQIKARLRWNIVPDAVQLEAGAANIFAGTFMKNAPNANGQGDATYFYAQAALTF